MPPPPLQPKGYSWGTHSNVPEIFTVKDIKQDWGGWSAAQFGAISEWRVTIVTDARVCLACHCLSVVFPEM